MKATELKKGAEYFWKRGWRIVWYLGKGSNGMYIFEDAGDEKIRLTEDDVKRLERRTR